MTAVTKRALSLVLLIGLAGSLFTTAIVSKFLLHLVTPGTPLSLYVSLLPLPFFAAFFWAAYFQTRQCDELQTRIQFEALAFAYPIAMIFVIMWVMVRKAGFDLPFDLGDLFIGMALLYCVGLLLARRRYR